MLHAVSAITLILWGLGAFSCVSALPTVVVYPPTSFPPAFTSLETQIPLKNPASLPSDEKERVLDVWASDPMRVALPVIVEGMKLGNWTVVNITVASQTCRFGVAGMEEEWGRVGGLCVGVVEGVSEEVVDVGVTVREKGSGEEVFVLGEQVVRYENRMKPMVARVISKLAPRADGGGKIPKTFRFGTAVAVERNNVQNGTRVFVGAAQDNTGGDKRGAVFRITLSPSGYPTDVLKIASNFNGGPAVANGDKFGSAIAWIGDVDGDKIASDIAVGATGVGNEQGAVFILSLGVDGTVRRSVRLASGNHGGPTLADGAKFGTAIAWLGNLNLNDASVEIAVGAPGASNGGIVYILSVGGSGRVSHFSLIPSVDGNNIPVIQSQDFFGSGISMLGDVDGDGIRSDLVIGASKDSAVKSEYGALHVLKVAKDGTVGKHWKIASTASGGPARSINAQFGTCVNWIGDIDGNGIASELGVGALSDDEEGKNRGSVFILFLGLDYKPYRSIKLASEEEGCPLLANNVRFGSSFAFLGDLDGDGVGLDVVVGANQDASGGSNSGAVHIFSLSDVSDASTPANIVGTASPLPFDSSLSSPMSMQTFPSYVASLDIHGADPSRQVLPLSVLSSTFNASGALKVVNVSIHAQLCGDAAIIDGWPQSNNTRRLGITCIGIPDGVWGREVHVSVALQSIHDGAQYTIKSQLPIVRYAKPDMDLVLEAPTSSLQLAKDAIPSNFGYASCSVPDMNGDGIWDLLVGDTHDSSCGNNCGAIHVVLLEVQANHNRTSLLSLSATNNLPLPTAGSKFGSSISVASRFFDQNGQCSSDSFDVVVGALGEDSDLGSIYLLCVSNSSTAVVHGRIASDTNGGPTIASEGKFGRSIATLGLYNGLLQVLVGAYHANGRDGVIYVLRVRKDFVVDSYAQLKHHDHTKYFGVSAVLLEGMRETSDGVFDFAVGSTGYDAFKGGVFLYSYDQSNQFELLNTLSEGTKNFPTLSDDARFGLSVATLGNCDAMGGAGLTLAVGSLKQKMGTAKFGAVFFLNLDSDGSILSSQVLIRTGGIPADAGFGGSLAVLRRISRTDDDDWRCYMAVGITGAEKGRMNLYALEDMANPNSAPMITGVGLPLPVNTPFNSHNLYYPQSPAKLARLSTRGTDPFRHILPLDIFTAVFDAFANVDVLNATIGGRLCTRTNTIAFSSPKVSTRRLIVGCVGIPDGEWDAVESVQVCLFETSRGAYCVAKGEGVSYESGSVSFRKLGSLPQSPRSVAYASVHPSMILLGVSRHDSRRGALFVYTGDFDSIDFQFQAEISSGKGGCPTLLPNTHFGVSVAWIGDLLAMGLGERDIAVGAIGDSEERPKCGAVYLFHVFEDGSSFLISKLTSSSRGMPILNDFDSLGYALLPWRQEGGEAEPSNGERLTLFVSWHLDDEYVAGVLYNRGGLVGIGVDADGSAVWFQEFGKFVDTGVDSRFGSSLGQSQRISETEYELVLGDEWNDEGGSDPGALFFVTVNVETGDLFRGIKIANERNGGPVLGGYNYFGMGLAPLGDFDYDGIRRDFVVSTSVSFYGCAFSNGNMVSTLVHSPDPEKWSIQRVAAPGASAKTWGTLFSDGKAIWAVEDYSTISKSEVAGITIGARGQCGSIGRNLIKRLDLPGNWATMRVDDDTLCLAVLTSTFNASYNALLLSAHVDSRPCGSVTLLPDWGTSANTRRIGVVCHSPPPGRANSLANVSVTYKDRQTSEVITVSSHSPAVQYENTFAVPVSTSKNDTLPAPVTSLTLYTSNQILLASSLHNSPYGSIFLLSSSLSLVNTFTYPQLPIEPASNFGSAIVWIGDANAVVGAPLARSGRGSIQVLTISSTTTPTLITPSSLPTSSKQMGLSLCLLSSLSIAVGGRGEVFVAQFSSISSPILSTSLTFSAKLKPETSTQFFGVALAFGGDWDIAVGGGGRVWLGGLSGAMVESRVDSVRGSSLVPSSATSSFGSSLSFLGDLDGDGTGNELVIGAVGSMFLATIGDDGIVQVLSWLGGEMQRGGIVINRGSVPFFGGIGDIGNVGALNDVMISTDETVHILNLRDLASLPTAATINSISLSDNPLAPLVATNITSIGMIDASTRAPLDASVSLLFSVRLTVHVSTVSLVQVMVGDAPCIDFSIIPSNWPSLSKHNQHILGVACRVVVANVGMYEEEDSDARLHGASIVVRHADSSLQTAKTTTPYTTTISSLVALHPSFAPTNPIHLQLLQIHQLRLSLENVLCMVEDGIAISNGGGDPQNISTAVVSAGEVLGWATEYNASFVGCRVGQWTQHLSAFGSKVRGLELEVQVIAPQMHRIECSSSNCTNQTLSVWGGERLRIFGRNFGTSSILSSSHPCFRTWTEDDGLVFVRSGEEAERVRIEATMFWIYIGSRPCAMIERVSDAILDCITMSGVGVNLDVTMVYGGYITKLSDAVSFYLPPLTGVAPLGPLQLYSPTNISVWGGLVDTLAQGRGYEVLPAHIAFEGLVRVGPWDTSSSDSIFVLSTDGNSYTIDATVMFGAGSDLPVTLCFHDASWQTTLAKSLLALFPTTLTVPCTPPPLSQSAKCFFTFPSISNPQPSNGLSPFGGTRVTINVENLGPPALYVDDILVLVDGMLAFDVSRAAIGATTDYISFSVPPSSVTSTVVQISVLGAESNTAPVSYTQVYVIGLSPQNVLPAAPGALHYSFNLAIIGLTAPIESLYIGGIKCPRVIRGKGTQVRCVNLPAPQQWPSVNVWVELEGGVGLSPRQPWMSPQDPPSVDNILTPSGSFSTTVEQNVTLLGSGFGFQKGDVERIVWTQRGDVLKTTVLEFEWIAGGRNLITAQPTGVGSSLCVEVVTRAKLTSPKYCVDFEKPLIASVQPSFALAGDASSSLQICGANFEVGNPLVWIGGLECGGIERTNRSCVVCSHLRWNSSATWPNEDAGVVLSVADISSDSFPLSIIPPPTVTSVTPVLAGPGSDITIRGIGLGERIQDVGLVDVGGERCRNLKWGEVGVSLQCTIPTPHQLWVHAIQFDIMVPSVTVSVENSVGVRGLSGSFEPEGLRVRPPPITVPIGFMAWRQQGQPFQLFLRWRHPGVALESLLIDEDSVDVLPAPATGFLVRLHRVDGSLVDEIVVSRPASRTKSATLGSLNRNASSSYDTHEANLDIGVREKLVVTMRVANDDSLGTEVVENAIGVPESCIQSQYLSFPSSPYGEQICVDCPDNGVCGGLDAENVTARSGSWRVAWDPLVFLQCFRQDACIGQSGGLIGGDDHSTGTTPSYLNTKENSSWNNVQRDWVQQDTLTLEEDTRAVPGLVLIPSDHERCAANYRGVMCAQCVQGAYVAIGGACSTCGSAAWVGLRLFLLSSAIGAGLSLLLWRAWNTRAESRSREMMIAKLLLTHVQTIAVVGSIDLRWPAAIRGFFDVLETSSAATASGMGFECLMGGRATDPIARTGIVYSAPLWLLAYAALLWGIVGFVQARAARMKAASKPARRRASQPVSPSLKSSTSSSLDGYWHEWAVTSSIFDVVTFRERMLVSTVVLLFLTHTPISRAALRIMTCRPIGQEGLDLSDDRIQLRLAMDLDYWCKGKEFPRMVAMGLPVVVLFSFGLPIAAWLFLRHLGIHRLQHDHTIRSRLGFLYLGYTPKYYFWECVILLRKVFIAMVTVLLGPYGGGIQALTALLLVLFSLVVHTWAKPYEANGQNKLEMFALVVAAVTLVGGLYLVLEDLEGSVAGRSGAEIASFMVVGSNVVLFFVALLQFNKVVRRRCERGEQRLQSCIVHCARQMCGVERGRTIVRRMSRAVGLRSLQRNPLLDTKATKVEEEVVIEGEGEGEGEREEEAVRNPLMESVQAEES